MVEASVWGWHPPGEMIMSVPETTARLHASRSMDTIYFFAEFDHVPHEDRVFTAFWYVDTDGTTHIMVDEEWARTWARTHPEHIVFAVDMVEGV